MLNFIKNLFGSGGSSISDALLQKAVVIDVRTRSEFQGGHVANSKNIPLNELGSELSRYSKDTPIVFCCASGGRSGAATSQANSQGYNAVNGGPWTSVNRVVAELQEQKLL